MAGIHRRNIFGVGNGTNTRAKLVALWRCLWFVRRMGLASIMIVGDSKAITDCVRGVTALHSLLLENWMGDVRKLISKFSHITFKHIFRELNDETDRLSKKGIDELDGNISFKEFRDEMPIQSSRLKFF